VPLRRPALLLLALLPACARERAPSLLLLTLDTTVPEALGCYGGPAGLTPSLDRLAREGILFADARAVAPLTLPAHASLLTGLYPPRHGIRRNAETRLPDAAWTLAERAAERGYQRAAFVAAVVLAPEFGLAQGFELYDAPATPAGVEQHLAASRPAHEIAARAREWLARRDRERPFFLWLHFYDPHFPYRPPREFLERAGGDAYLGEVAAMDAAIGTVLAELEAQGEYERALIVAAADHGEGRGRHGEDTHGGFVFDSTLRIPLVVRLPGAARAGERVRAPTSQVDVAPLVLAVLGWEAPSAHLTIPLDGRDPLGGAHAHGVYFESYFGTRAFGWSSLAGWTDGRAKYVHSSAPELFDLALDPGETRSVLAERASDAAALRARITELCARPRLERELVEAEDLQREIERLGYAGAAAGAEEDDPEPLAASSSPSPHRMIAAYADYMEGRKLFEEEGPREPAIALLERAVQANPENHKAWFTLGLARMDLARFEAAADAFRRVLAVPGGERISARLDLAVCLYNLGRSAEALAELERALSETAGPPGALELLVRLLEEHGRTEDAAKTRMRLGPGRALASE
jgi:arylsulfatase A-like enzyme/Tfp pilus assembly protein PilF